MSRFEVKRFLLLVVPLPILLMIPAAFMIRGLWLPAVGWSLVAAHYLALIWRWDRRREADEAIARAELHEAAEAEMGANSDRSGDGR